MQKLSRRIAISLISLLPLTSWAGADLVHSAQAVQIRAAVDAAIRPLMAEYDVPGMAVAVTINGQSMFFQYGVASRANKTPVSETTLFEIGSISKTFAATMATYAQVLGKLSMDDHPSRYMPALKGKDIDQASLLHLGTYTAGGLPLQFPDDLADAQVTTYFQTWKATAAAGSQREYSNPSLGLFGHLTALALKADFRDVMETQIFPQLGLQHSYLDVPKTAMGNYAWGYNRANQAIRMNPGALAAPTYGVKSSAADMLRFVQVNIDASGLEPTMQRALAATHVGYFKVGTMVQGLGWEQYPYPVTLEHLLAGNSESMLFDANPAQKISAPQAPVAATLFNKTGSTNGFGGYVAFVPEQKIGIVMLANKNYPIPARIKAGYAILEQLAISSVK
ncbi:class C beta-lactamase [Undibacterium sp. Ren11W]|uniref:class C beta-lactamase n=1 Tax=Undibacterium sp. Ren11W TaxID=3413045 RepID=UPI003BF0FB8E